MLEVPTPLLLVATPSPLLLPARSREGGLAAAVGGWLPLQLGREERLSLNGQTAGEAFAGADGAAGTRKGLRATAGPELAGWTAGLGKDFRTSAGAELAGWTTALRKDFRTSAEPELSGCAAALRKDFRTSGPELAGWTTGLGKGFRTSAGTESAGGGFFLGGCVTPPQKRTQALL